MFSSYVTTFIWWTHWLFQYLLMIYSRMTSATTKELHCFSTLFYALEFIQLVQHTVLCIRVHTTGELNTDHTTTDIDTDTECERRWEKRDNDWWLKWNEMTCSPLYVLFSLYILPKTKEQIGLFSAVKMIQHWQSD